MSDSFEKPIHPGEVLGEVYMKSAQPPITVPELAGFLQVPAGELSRFLGGKRSVTMPLAARLAIRFRTSRSFWLGLQEQYNRRLPVYRPHHVRRLRT